MISKIRLAFGLILAITVMSTLVIFVISDSKQYKYRISIPHGSDYYTNSYISNGSCITFKNECGCKDKKTITVCGNYTIITR